MYKIFTIPIILQILSQTLAENKTKDIEALEKEKSDLFNQINNAIDESVKALNQNNDTEALLGVEYMTRLREQLRVINNTDFKQIILPNDTGVNITAERRFDMFDIASVFKKPDFKQISDARQENEKLIRIRLNDWIEQRELEKQKILLYKLKMKQNMKVEKCPNYGIADKKKRQVARAKKDGRRRKKKKTTAKSRPMYPCCRKCCKKSYLGCL